MDNQTVITARDIKEILKSLKSDKELRLSESFEIWGKDGEYFGAYSKKDVMTKLDGLDAEQQEKTQSIDEEKDLELDEFEK